MKVCRVAWKTVPHQFWTSISHLELAWCHSHSHSIHLSIVFTVCYFFSFSTKMTCGNLGLNQTNPHDKWQAKEHHFIHIKTKIHMVSLQCGELAFSSEVCTHNKLLVEATYICRVKLSSVTAHNFLRCIIYICADCIEFRRSEKIETGNPMMLYLERNLLVKTLWELLSWSSASLFYRNVTHSYGSSLFLPLLFMQINNGYDITPSNAPYGK